ncbi:MAG: signal recognition particle-docking protein FtsY [Candidatus Heimdallarchaeum endolithica]|uniref:Signal recognition particle-docking protein FtsY n=1 Tax=Candidatus Heimdallarchaeum endolithica TaxID=2876572 RepID=A0A9Y1FMN7_9ARCH|nr:MAG: signal recognition particle-docking protein FtsY [Candidatus Heimdallarchaeum endolithica]
MFKNMKKSLSSLLKKITIAELNQKTIKKVIHPLKDILIQNEVAVVTADKICESVSDKLLNVEYKRMSSPKSLILEALRSSLLEILQPEETINLLSLVEEYRKKKQPLVIAFFGINGVGKTLSIAKLGYYLKKNDISSVFAASDTFRAGSIQQLEQHAKKVGVKIISQTYGSDAAAVAFDAVSHASAKGIDVVLIDTAGRMETNKNLMAELQKLDRVVEPDLKIFVGDALTGNSLVSQAELFNSKIGIDASIINKMDADVKGGATISVVHATRKPILFIGVGQKYNDLKPFIPEQIIKNVLPDKI